MQWKRQAILLRALKILQRKYILCDAAATSKFSWRRERFFEAIKPEVNAVAATF